MECSECVIVTVILSWFLFMFSLCQVVAEFMMFFLVFSDVLLLIVVKHRDIAPLVELKW